MHVNTQVRYQSNCLFEFWHTGGWYGVYDTSSHWYTHLYLKTQTEMEYLIRSSSAGVCSLQRCENYEYRARQRKCYN